MADLAAICQQAVDSLAPVLEFLARYGFVKRVTRNEWLFTKRPHIPPPGEVVAILEATLPDRRVVPV